MVGNAKGHGKTALSFYLSRDGLVVSTLVPRLRAISSIVSSLTTNQTLTLTQKKMYFCVENLELRLICPLVNLASLPFKLFTPYLLIYFVQWSKQIKNLKCRNSQTDCHEPMKYPNCAEVID